MTDTTCELVLGVTDEGFVTAVDNLEEALAARLIGREHAWSEEVRAALADMTTAVRGHIAAAHFGPHSMASVLHSQEDNDDQLRGEHFRLLEQTCVLQRQLTTVRQSFVSPPYTVFDEVLQGGKELVEALRQHQDKEAA